MTARTKITKEGGGLTSLRSTNPRPWFCLGSSDKTSKSIQEHSTSIFTDFLIFYYKARQNAKWAAIQVATMLADHKQIAVRTTMRN